MLHQWKFILSNWINCYFNDTKTEECITTNTLLTIISHLHKNLNLDESKSSILEAQNIEEFILEKYPKFKFGNGTVEPSNEEELYYAASLLLFFVCVNSKDVDIKQAMCSRLSPDDQETIMKFSKCLMECPSVTYKDVQTAIIDACGQEIAGEKGAGPGPSVAQTPPVLRSLHGEVRRLQAALDAERFDRNYLQEELSRTNLKMEKLLKDKEQYKLEIMNLKAKISLCCGQESEARGSEATSDNAAQLTRQLHELEERLVDTQGQLDDAQYERDTYKTKINELKQERDKWLTVSQEESSRSSQLAQELESERRRVVTLQELVAELRQHHQNNRLDASQLECDDPDASIHSLHNASVCSEACANVIEVQLGEERAKVDTLKQQMQLLQEQLNELTQKTESEKLALENIITEKDNDITDLKHRINEEIQEKTYLKQHFNEEVSKLNNDINELENRLTENCETSRLTIEQKMQEIQTLQEEKLSLLQSLSDETTKLENIIKNLKIDIDTERNLKIQMREKYENEMMTLKEKVLNRNNELVELQNKVFEKGEMIENLNRDLKKEKESIHELSNKHNNEIAKFNGEKNLIESKLLQKSDEAKELQKRLFQNVVVFDELNRDIDDLKAANDNLLQNYKLLENANESLQLEIQQRDNDVAGIRKEIENITNIFSEEKHKFMRNLEERNATIKALQVQLEDHMKYKTSLEKELQHLHQAKILLNEDVLKLSKDLSKVKTDITDKDRMIYALNFYLKEERHTNLTLKTKLEKQTEEIKENSAKISAMDEKLTNEKLVFEEQLREKDELLESTNSKLMIEMEEKEELQLMLMSVNDEKEIINKDLMDRCTELDRLQEDYGKLCSTHEQNVKVIEALGNKIDNETKKYLQLEIDFDTHTSNLIAKLSETERTVKDINSKSKLKVKDMELQIQNLQTQVENLIKTIEDNRSTLEKTLREKEALVCKLKEETSFKNNIEKEYQNQCAMLDVLSSQLNGECALKSTEINSLKVEVETLLNKLNDTVEELKDMEIKMMEEQETSREKSQEIKHLQAKVEDLHRVNDEIEQKLKEEIDSKTQTIETLQKENEQLHYAIEEDNSNHEIIVKEKDFLIEVLEEHVKVLTMSLESLRKDYENSTFIWEKTKLDMLDKLEAKDNEIVELKEQLVKLKQCLEQVMADVKQVRKEVMLRDGTINEELDRGSKLQRQIDELIAETKELGQSNYVLKIELCEKKFTEELLKKENAELLQQNAGLLEELYQEQLSSNTVLAKHKEIINEKSVLSQQLSEEKCARTVVEQEIKTLLEARKVIEKQLAEKNEMEMSLLADKDLLITEKTCLTQLLEATKKDKETTLAEKQIIEQKLREKDSKIETILAEMKNFTQQLEVVGLVKKAYVSEKQAIEQELFEEKSAAAALVEENKQLSLDKDILSQKLASMEVEKQNLLVEKQTIEQQKEQLLEEKESEGQVKETLLAENHVMEQQLIEQEEVLKVLVREKEQLLVAIGNLSEQLEKAENEKQVLLLNKQKIDQQLIENEAQHKIFLDEKEILQKEKDLLSKRIELLLAEKQEVEQQVMQAKTEKNMISEEKNSLILQLEHNSQQLKAVVEQKESLEQQLTERVSVESVFVKEKETIEKQLEVVQEIAGNEKQELINKIQALEEEIKAVTTSQNELLEVKDYLLKQIEILEKEKLDLSCEYETKNLTLKENMEQLSQKLFKEQAERQNLQKQVLEEVADKNTLLEVKEYLGGQLIAEKSAKELLVQEKETLQEDLSSLNCLLQEKKNIIAAKILENSRLHEQIAERTQEITEVNNLLQDELSTKVQLKEAKDSLLGQIDFLKNNNFDLDAIKDILVDDMKMMNVEKEQLVKSLSVEKASRDELESEKNAVSVALRDLNHKHGLEIKEKQEQICVVSRELKEVKMDFKKHEDISVHLASVVNSGLDKLLQNIEKEAINNDILRKLIATELNESVPLSEKCDLIINIANTLTNELASRCNLEKALEDENSAVQRLKEMIKEKETKVLNMQIELETLQKAVKDSQNEMIKQAEIHNTTLESKIKDIQTLQMENKSLNNELNDVKVQLEVKVHYLKEKLTDSEILIDKLKTTYECQIENLNVMLTKMTSYLKDKTCELDAIRAEKEKLQQVVDENSKVIGSLEEEVKTQKANQEKLITDFESERQVMKNMVTVTESIMEDQKVGFDKVRDDYEKTIEKYRNDKKNLEQLVEATQKKGENFVQEKQCAFDTVFKELAELRKEKEIIVKDLESNTETLNKEIMSLKDELDAQKSVTKKMEQQNEDILKEKEALEKEIAGLKNEINEKVSAVQLLQDQNEVSTVTVNKLRDELLCLQEIDTELKMQKDSIESDLLNRIDRITKVVIADTSKNNKFKYNLQEKLQKKVTIQEKIEVLTDEVEELVKEKNEYISKLDEAKAKAEANGMKAKNEFEKWKNENRRLSKVIEENKDVIANLQQQIEREAMHLKQLRDDHAHQRLTYENRCALLQEYQNKAEKHLQERDKEITSFKQQLKTEVNLDQVVESLKEEIIKKDTKVAEIAQVKDDVINALSKELQNEKEMREKYQNESESKNAVVQELKQKLEEVASDVGALEARKKEYEDMTKAIGLAAASQERMSLNRYMELRDRHQVSTPTSDLTHSSMDSLKTISDLEKIIQDKNRTITTLHSDVSYLQSLMADSENKLLDITKELEISKENCEQLSSQLKKLVQQKNEEIADLKKQVSKMSVTENRATQIIKVSAKYQAIILKRIAEIKSNTILKELTNFGNTANCDSDLKRNLNSGAITLEDLESFLETTDKHLKRCSEKQLALQKERDRLNEVNRINESEIINLKKFLTELSVSFKTFNSIKDLYTQKLSRVVLMQRTVRREILSLDGQIIDSTMCKLERGYTAVMQDLCECSMNLERWVERSIARTISSEKIKQAFTSDTERVSLASSTFQNASLEVQLEELENSFQKILEEVVRAQKGEGVKDAQAVTVMEVRAEYEDKLNRMKAKMKQLYQDQIQVFKNKQKEEIAALDSELQKTREKLAESSRAYEEHIKALTAELWSVGEKFLVKKDEAEWLRKKQKHGSLMSLQHLHSVGLSTNHEEVSSIPSDTQSLRSLPAAHLLPRERKREGRGLHMSDEEGEVFDNRWLKELRTPRRESNVGLRMSELRRRNSLCPPHLKSSYPAETQFANTLDEEDIKCVEAPSAGGRLQRKEVGITAYKKPGPPTPSKQAGRLSATDCELRESLRTEPSPAPARKTSTPSRIRALFRSARSDVTDQLPVSVYPICETNEYPKCDYINSASNSDKINCDTENDSEKLQNDIEKIKHNFEKLKHYSEKLKHDSTKSEYNSEMPKHGIEKLKHNFEKPSLNLEKPNHNLEMPNHNLEKPNLNLEKPKQVPETPNHNLEKPNHDFENPIHNLEKPKQIIEMLNHNLDKDKHDFEKPNHNSEKPKQDTEKLNNDSVKPKCGSNKLEYDPSNPKSNSGKPIGDSEKPIDGATEKPERFTEKHKCDSEKPKCDLKKLKVESVKPKCDSEKPQCDSAKPKYDSEKPNYDFEKPNYDFEKLISDSEITKCDSEKSKYNSDNRNCNSKHRKSDWFKLNLRQRAALWEPLAKD